MKKIAKKKWTIEGYDTFSGEPYSLPGQFTNESKAHDAGKKRLEELEKSQPSNASGGQGQNGIQDQVFIVRPNGSKYRLQ